MTQGQMRQQYPVAGQPFSYRIEGDGNHVAVYINDDPIEIDINRNGPSQSWCRWQDKLWPYALVWEGERLHLWLDGRVFIFNRVARQTTVRRSIDGEFAPSADQARFGLHLTEDNHKIVSQMAGRVLSVKVKPGDDVSSGDEVCVLEAMKMEHSIRVNIDGVVKAVHVEANQQVSAGELLIELEE